MASTSKNNNRLSDIPELDEQVDTTDSNLQSGPHMDTRLHRFNSLMTELDEIGRNLKVLKAGYEKLGEGSNRISTGIKDLKANLEIHKKTATLVRPEPIPYSVEREKAIIEALEKKDQEDTELHYFVLPDALAEKEKDPEQSEEEIERKSEFVMNLIMSSLFRN